MSTQAVFIVDKVENTLIFLEYLEENIKINQKELSNILGKIMNNSKELKSNSFIDFEINEKCYFYGVFDNLLLIFQHQRDFLPPEELLIELYNCFVKVFANILNNYTYNDLSKFRSFAKVVREVIPKYLHHTRKKETDIGSKSIINPIKRDFYPTRPSVYKRDEILYNEAKYIKQKFATEYIDGFIFKLHIYLTISPTQCYKIYIDFSDYPLKPTIKIDEVLNKDLGKNLDEILYFYRTWDKKRPPHIIELVNELEAILLQYNSKGRLSKIPIMTRNSIPEIKHLPNLE
ncbi:MAG: hypothetical protein ACFFDK_00860 [Promethearchaeota archaeon]